jgi:aminopeptidase
MNQNSPSSYQPSPKILQKYAQILVNFALNSGQGIKPGQSVMIQIPESAKPMYVFLRNSVLEAGGNPFMVYLAEDVRSSDFYNLANPEQLVFFPSQYYKGLVKQFDHSITIIAEKDKFELKDVPASKILAKSNAFKPYFRWREQKENQGRFTWTLALYATPAMAKEAGLGLEEYWQQIIEACFLDFPDPIAKWQAVTQEMNRLRTTLNQMNIEKLSVQAEDFDLTVKIGPKRLWLGGSGRNIPSFELFISPDWRGTSGHYHSNQPLYYYGNVVRDIHLTFQNGLVSEGKAGQNDQLLQAILTSKNANKIGEFSLTDHRFSRITKNMAETLFDENIGGIEGNTHLALGNAYKDCFPGQATQMKDKDWASLGYNQSPIHIDLISTTPRKVTAHLSGGQTKLIYQNGEFQL